jgi:hypothetical protein
MSDNFGFNDNIPSRANIKDNTQRVLDYHYEHIAL